MNIPGAVNPRSGKGLTSLAAGKYGFGLYARTSGFRNVERNFYTKVAEMQGATRMGIVRSVQHLRKKMLNEHPQEPWGEDKFTKGVMTHKGGTLSHAWEVEETSFSTLQNPSYIFGYNMEEAPYAWYVHEMTQPPYGDVQWTKGLGVPARGNPGPQWFFVHFQRERLRMLEIIRENIEIAIK